MKSDLTGLEKKCATSGSDVLALDIASLTTGGVAAVWQEESGDPHKIVVSSLDNDLSWGTAQDVATGTMDPDGSVAVLSYPGNKVLVVWAEQGPGTGLDVWARFVQVE